MRSQDRGNKKRTRQKVRNEKIKIKIKKSEKSVDVFSDRLDQIEEKNNTLEDKTLNKLITDGKKEK